jgi:hypothetical protein
LLFGLIAATIGGWPASPGGVFMPIRFSVVLLIGVLCCFPSAHAQEAIKDDGPSAADIERLAELRDKMTDSEAQFIERIAYMRRKQREARGARPPSLFPKKHGKAAPVKPLDPVRGTSPVTGKPGDPPNSMSGLRVNSSMDIGVLSDSFLVERVISDDCVICYGIDPGTSVFQKKGERRPYKKQVVVLIGLTGVQVSGKLKAGNWIDIKDSPYIGSNPQTTIPKEASEAVRELIGGDASISSIKFEFITKPEFLEAWEIVRK